MSETTRPDDYIARQERASHNALAVVNQLESHGWRDAKKYVTPLNEFTMFVHTGHMEEQEEQRFIDRYEDEPYVTELEEDVDGRVWRWNI